MHVSEKTVTNTSSNIFYLPLDASSCYSIFLITITVLPLAAASLIFEVKVKSQAKLRSQPESNRRPQWCQVRILTTRSRGFNICP